MFQSPAKRLFIVSNWNFIHRAVIKDDDKSLIIKNVIPADEGIYICDAHNGVGQISAKAQLIVNCMFHWKSKRVPAQCIVLIMSFHSISAQPSFNVKPQDQKVGLNGIASFQCEATGNPSPSIFWAVRTVFLFLFYFFFQIWVKLMFALHATLFSTSLFTSKIFRCHVYRV